jgi:hypothetical protein
MRLQTIFALPGRELEILSPMDNQMKENCRFEVGNSRAQYSTGKMKRARAPGERAADGKDMAWPNRSAAQDRRL